MQIDTSMSSGDQEALNVACKVMSDLANQTEQPSSDSQTTNKIAKTDTKDAPKDSKKRSYVKSGKYAVRKREAKAQDKQEQLVQKAAANAQTYDDCEDNVMRDRVIL